MTPATGMMAMNEADRARTFLESVVAALMTARAPSLSRRNCSRVRLMLTGGQQTICRLGRFTSATIRCSRAPWLARM